LLAHHSLDGISMSILVVTPEFPPTTGGIGTNAFDLATQWSRSEPVVVVAPRLGDRRDFTPSDLRMEEVPWHELGRLQRVLGIQRTVRRLISESRFDVIYSTHWRACGAATRAALLGMRDRPPLVQAVHGSELLNVLSRLVPFERAAFNWTARGVDLFTGNGSYQVSLLGRLGIAKDRVATGIYGVWPDRFAPPPHETVVQLRKRYDLEDRPVLMTVGRLVERKGYDVVIQAMPEIRRSLPGAVYVIAGPGEYADRLHRLAADVGLPADALRFTGPIGLRDLTAYYGLCDVFVMPNRIAGADVEGFGLVFIEAALCGKPSIGGRSGGAVDAIVDGVTGRLVDPTSVGDVATAAIELLSNPSLASQMGAAGRKRALAEFDYSILASRLRSAFPDRLKQPRVGQPVTPEKDER
jgi:phosphatidyl-myo-inositol dimannoside synthase